MKNTRFFALLRMTTLLVVMFICDSQIANAQDAPQYKYYFLMIRATGKAEVEISPEMGVEYPDIEPLIVGKKEQKKKGESITGKKYESYSDAFNVLSATGLEFVQFVTLPSVGGMTIFVAGDMKLSYTMWRKRTN